MRPTAKNGTATGHGNAWDHSTHQDFYDYYASESRSEATLQCFRAIQATVLRVAAQTGMRAQLNVADVGCGAGTQSRLWAERGHRVFGLDVNERLIRLARQRTEETAVVVTTSARRQPYRGPMERWTYVCSRSSSSMSRIGSRA